MVKMVFCSISFGVCSINPESVAVLHQEKKDKKFECVIFVDGKDEGVVKTWDNHLGALDDINAFIDLSQDGTYAYTIFFYCEAEQLELGVDQ